MFDVLVLVLKLGDGSFLDWVFMLYKRLNEEVVK